MGDILFMNMYPFIDLSSGGSVDGVLTAVQNVFALAGPDTKVIPGHGPLTDMRGLAAYQKMLTTVSGRVRDALGVPV